MGGILDFLGIGKDIKDATDGIGTNVAKIIDSAKGQLPPEQQVQMAQIKADLDKQTADLKAKSEEMVMSFATQYEGTAEQVAKIAPWIVILRDLIRPVTTIVFFLQLACIVTVELYRAVFLNIAGWTMLDGLPTGYWVLQSIIFGFWFGGKAGERIATAFGQASK